MSRSDGRTDVMCWGVLVTVCAEYVNQHPETFAVVDQALRCAGGGEPRDLEIAMKDPMALDHGRRDEVRLPVKEESMTHAPEVKP